MKRFAIAGMMLSAALATPAHATDGLVAVPCMQTSRMCLDRLETLAKSRGLKVFARIDHAAGAASIGETLRPTELMIFGHPKGGTPLLKCSQAYGISLPLHVLAWEDVKGKHWIGYRDPAGVAQSHPDVACNATLKQLTQSLDEMVRLVASQP